MKSVVDGKINPLTEKEYVYTKNRYTFSQVLINWVRGILETILPFLKVGPFPKLLDKLFASRFARSFLGSYGQMLLM